MSEVRRHPDLFTAREAMEYLHLSPESTSTIETLRNKGMLTGWGPGKELLYHREELDAIVNIGFSGILEGAKRRKQAQPTTGPRLRIAGGK